MNENENITVEQALPDAPAASIQNAPAPNQLVVDTGEEVVEICNRQGKVIGTLYFQPADMGIVDRWNAFMKDFGEITKPLENVPDTEDGALAAITEAKNRLCAALDAVFDGNVSEAFFAKRHPFAPVNGHFYCENVMDAIATYMGQRFQQEFDRINRRQRDRMAAYTHGARTGKHKDGKTRPAAKK